MGKKFLQAFLQFPFYSIIKFQTDITYFCDTVALTEFTFLKYVKLPWSPGLTKNKKKLKKLFSEP